MGSNIRSNRTSFTTAHFALLSESQKEEIHLATLEVLHRTGVRVFCPEAIELLRRAGCTVNDGNTVRIPPHLVEEAIRTAPATVAVYDRHGEPAMFLESTRVHYGTGSDLPNVIDPRTGERRPSAKADIENAARVCDALPNIDFVMSMALPGDVPVASSDRHSFEAMVTNTSKPIVYTAHDRAGLSDILDMAAVVAGSPGDLAGRPFMVLYAEPSTPLQHSREAVEKLLLVAEKHMPVAYVPGSVTGASTPVTMGGSALVINAELLSGLLIAQLKRPGAPCIFGSGAGPLDMRTMVAAYAAPEYMLLTSAMVEMGQYYKLPTWGFAGCSDAKLFDQQAALEGALWTIMAALSGANLVHDVGYLESGLTCSLEMLVTMDEAIAMVKRLMGGFDLSPDALAIDLIDEIGPGGSFFASEHTLKHYRETWYPTLLDRRDYADWTARGQQDLGQRASHRVQEILDGHVPPPLAQGIREQLTEILRRAEGRTKGK